MKLIDNIHREEVIDKLTNALYANGCNRNIIKNAFRDVNKVKTSNVKEEETIGIAVTPHIKTLKQYKIRIAYKSYATISAVLGTAKEAISLENQGIYQVACNDYELVYIGETNRRIAVRIEEHVGAIKKLDQANALAKHVRDTGHVINFKETKTLAKEERLFHRKLRKRIEIKKQII